VRRLHTTAHMDGHGHPQVWVVGCMLLETVYVSCLTCFHRVSLDHLLVAAGVEGSDSATLPTAHWCMVSMDGDD